MDFEISDAKAGGAECKGQFFRVRESRFRTSAGAITLKREYRPLSRMSCPGCDQCDWMWDDLQERSFKVIDGGKDGDLVKLQMTNISHDCESGYIDDFDMEFVRVDQPLSRGEKHGG